MTSISPVFGPALDLDTAPLMTRTAGEHIEAGVVGQAGGASQLGRVDEADGAYRLLEGAHQVHGDLFDVGLMAFKVA